MMAPGAELVLETLIVEGPKGYSLTPDGRYAQMRNVHCLPSIGTLESWLIDMPNLKISMWLIFVRLRLMNSEERLGLVIMQPH